MNVKNTYLSFILVEYDSFQHGKPSVFWSTIQIHTDWSRNSSQMNLWILVLLLQMVMLKIIKISLGFTQAVYLKTSQGALLKAYLAIEWHLSLLGYKRTKWPWSVDSQEKLKDVMKRKTYSLQLTFQTLKNHTIRYKKNKEFWYKSP